MYQSIIISIVSGLLLGLSFNYAHVVWFLGLVAIVPFFFVLNQYVQSRKQAFFLGWLFGFSFIGFVEIWVWDILPLDWFGINDTFFSIVTIFVSWSFSAAILSLFIGLWAAMFYTLKGNPIKNIILAPALWILFEYLRTYGFSLLVLGPSSLIGPHFTIGFLGYMLSGSEVLLQLGRFGGVYTLGFFVVFANILVYTFLVSSFPIKKKVIVAVFTLAVVAVIYMGVSSQYIHGRDNGDERTLSVAVLHTSFGTSLSLPKEESQKRFSEHSALIKTIRDNGAYPDIIVFPEGSRFLSKLFNKGESQDFFGSLFGDHEMLVIDSSRTKDISDDIKSRLFYYNTKTNTAETTDKLFLVPQGEYTPYLYTLITRLFGRDDVLTSLKINQSYKKGEDVSVASFKDIKIGGLFCSDILSTTLYKRLVEKEANILVNVASQSIFHGSKTLYNQVLSMAKVRAVEHNRYFIQASNVAPSFVINNKGVVIAESGWGRSSILYGEVEALR